MIKVDHRLPVLRKSMIERQIVGDNEIGLGRYVGNPCVCESEPEKIRMVGNCLGITVDLIEFADEISEERRTLPTGLFGKVPQQIAHLRQNGRGRDRRLERCEEATEKIEIVFGKRIGPRKPLNSMWILDSDNLEKKQVGVDENALRSMPGKELFEVITHFRRSGSSWREPPLFRRRS